MQGVNVFARHQVGEIRPPAHERGTAVAVAGLGEIEGGNYGDDTKYETEPNEPVPDQVAK